MAALRLFLARARGYGEYDAEKPLYSSRPRQSSLRQRIWCLGHIPLTSSEAASGQVARKSHDARPWPAVDGLWCHKALSIGGPSV